jgi:uncharacterized membrane protein
MVLSDRSLLLSVVASILLVWTASLPDILDKRIAASGIAYLLIGCTQHVLKVLGPVLRVAILPRVSVKRLPNVNFVMSFLYDFLSTAWLTL